LNIGIVSDSHDNLPAIRSAVKLFREKQAELVIHAGDFVAPFAVKELLALGVPLIAVFGNCDGEHKMIAGLLPDIVAGARKETLGGRAFVVIHSLDWLEPAGRAEAEVIVCGHTHKPSVSDGTAPLIVNPGECSGWLTGRPTVAWLDTDAMKAEILDLRIS